MVHLSSWEYICAGRVGGYCQVCHRVLHLSCMCVDCSAVPCFRQTALVSVSLRQVCTVLTIEAARQALVAHETGAARIWLLTYVTHSTKCFD